MKCIGAICGDICGQPMEFTKDKIKDYELLSKGGHFTDDTVLTIAIMEWLCNIGTPSEISMSEADIKESLIKLLKSYGREYWYAGFGGSFNKWMHSDNSEPYNSWGNGSAMRVSPIAWWFDTLDDVLKYAKISAEVTHNHEEGIKGAQALACCIFLARNGKTKEEIKKFIRYKFDYDLNRTVDDMVKDYKFEVSCQKSVPESIICFLESTSVENAIQKAIFMGGDTDTMGDMAASIAEAYYNPIQTLNIFNECKKKTKIPSEFMDVITVFNRKITNMRNDNEKLWQVNNL